MAADDRDPDAPSLEPPSLFRRRRKPPPEPTPEPAPDATVPPAPPVEAPPVEAPPVEAPPVEEPPTEGLAPVADPEPEPEPAPMPTPVPEAAPEPAPALFADEIEPEPTATPAPEAPRAPRVPRAPLVTGLVAALVTGALVGLAVVALTAGGEQVCEAAQGTSSCGRAGYPMVLAILVVAVLLGGALLRWSQVPDPTSTSFLAVGLLTVIALVFLVDALDSWWMLLVIPLVSAATYAGSHWVTTAVIEPARDEG